jgi:hypothetical protein
MVTVSDFANRRATGTTLLLTRGQFDLYNTASDTDQQNETWILAEGRKGSRRQAQEGTATPVFEPEGHSHQCSRCQEIATASDFQRGYRIHGNSYDPRRCRWTNCRVSGEGHGLQMLAAAY